MSIKHHFYNWHEFEWKIGIDFFCKNSSLLNGAKGRESLLQFNLYLTFYGRAWPYGVPRPPPVRQIADPDTSVVASANDAGAVVSLWGSGHLNFRAPWRHKYYYDVICLYYKEGKGRGSLPFAARFASSRRLRVEVISLHLWRDFFQQKT